MKKKNLAFTLAEVLIVIGIIGVVAALTLPNLNHATSDKETVTRLQKAYSILNEANDRAVAIYGPLSTWKDCYPETWLERIGQFLKVSKKANFGDDIFDTIVIDGSNSNMGDCNNIAYQLPDGIVICANDVWEENCNGSNDTYKDLCIKNADIAIDVNGPKGKNAGGIDQFSFDLSDSLGLVADSDNATRCMRYKSGSTCTYWILENGNMDYLKTDSTGKCNDSNIILDGTTNTSCH